MKLFRSRIGLALLVVALLVVALLIVRVIVSPKILRAHTSFLFQQLDQAYQGSVTSGQQRATSSQEFLDRIPQRTIDWNSCGFRDHIIYDSWGTPAEIRIDPSSINLRSAGPDRLFNTPDDLSHKIANPTGA